MKRIQALIAAVIITSLIGLGMLAVGVNAALNPNTVPISDAPGFSPTTTATSSQDQAQINRLQNLVAQYQAQLNQANAQIQDYQGLLEQLQQRGIIRINSDGTIQLPRRSFGGGDDGGG